MNAISTADMPQKVPGELSMIIVVSVIAIIVSHHGHYRRLAPLQLGALFTLM